MSGSAITTGEFDAHKKDSRAHGLNQQTKAYIDAEGYVPLTPVDITADFTWDGTQRTLDLTARTHASARLALISVYMDKENDYPAPLAFRTVGGAADVIRFCGDKHTINETDSSVHYYRFGTGGTFVPLDSQQRIDYLAPNGLGSKTVYLLGYYKTRA